MVLRVGNKQQPDLFRKRFCLGTQKSAYKKNSIVNEMPKTIAEGWEEISPHEQTGTWPAVSVF